MASMVKLYNQKTGDSIECWPVDAKEMLNVNEGLWGFDPPLGLPVKQKTVINNNVEEEKRSPLRLVPNLTAAGEKALKAFGIETLEELGKTPLFKLQSFGPY